jgi:hypothetical protein
MLRPRALVLTKSHRQPRLLPQEPKGRKVMSGTNNYSMRSITFKILLERLYYQKAVLTCALEDQPDLGKSQARARLNIHCTVYLELTGPPPALNAKDRTSLY